MSRSSLIKAIFMIFALVAVSTAAAQTPPGPDASKQERLAYWADVMKAATARIDVLDADGEKLRETYGVSLGQPARLVTRLTALAGASKLAAEFPGGEKATAESVVSFDPVNDIAVLGTEGTLPNPPEPDDKIKWRYRERIYVIPAPGMDQAWLSDTLTAPLELGDLRLAPMTGDHQGGLPVMYGTGWWIGMSGRIEDETGTFIYMTPMEQVLPVLFADETATSLAEAAATVDEHLAPESAEGLLARAVITSFKSPEDSRPFFDLAIERGPEIPESHFWYGKMLFEVKEHEEAENAFIQACRLRPEYESARQMAGASANQQGDYNGALVHYEEGLKLFPESTKLMINKWGALYNLGQMKAAVAVLKDALKIDPGYQLAYYNLGITYHFMGQHLDAEEQYVKLDSMNSRFAPMLRKRLDGDHEGHQH